MQRFAIPENMSGKAWRSSLTNRCAMNRAYTQICQFAFYILCYYFSPIERRPF